MEKHKEHSVITLTNRLTNIPLGAKGTIVHVYESADDVYEVEFEVGGQTKCLTLKGDQFIKSKEEKNMKLSEKGYPIILVFYVEKAMMGNKEMFDQYATNIEQYLNSRNANIVTLFMPTEEGKDHVECINPKLIDEVENKDIVKLLMEIKSNFGF